MDKSVYTVEEVQKELLEKFGNGKLIFSFIDDNLDHRAVFLFEEAQIVAFFDGKKTVAPLEFNWLDGCTIEETVNYIEREKVERNTPFLGNAIIGALLGGFFYASEKRVTKEVIEVKKYWLTITLKNYSVEESTFYVGSNYDYALKAKQLIESIMNRIKTSSSNSSKPNDKLIKVKEKDYPMSFWVYVPIDYMDNVDDEYIYIPKSIFDNAQCEFEKAQERDRKIAETASLNNQGIAFEKEGNIDKAIEVYEKNVAKDTDGCYSYDRLLVIYKKLKREDDEFRICQLAVKKFPNEKKYLLRLQKLQGNEPAINLPNQALIYTPTIIWGELYFNELRQLKEFDFYSQGYENRDYYMDYVSNNNLTQINNVVKHFQELRHIAENAEDAGNYATASAIYEQMIAEKCYFSKPYDRLIKIYSKSKLKEDEKRVLLSAIETLQGYKDIQLSYIRGLAKKYNAVDFCENYIAEGKSISYFMMGGGFVIYDPYNIIEKWRERLEKMK